MKDKIGALTKSAEKGLEVDLDTVNAVDPLLELDLELSPMEGFEQVKPPGYYSPSDSLPGSPIAKARSNNRMSARRRRDAAALRSTNSLSRSSHRYHFGG